MAEAEAGQDKAQEQEEQQGQEQQKEQQEGQGKQTEKVYSQAEVDRILSKVRKNARYLGRKEAEAELLARGATPKQAAEAVREEPKAEAQPKREDFETYEDYLVAKARFEGRAASREEREAAEKAQRERTIAEQKTKTEREFRKRAEAVMEEIPDFAETIESAEDVMITKAMGEAIEESEHGPRILYHLVKNRQEAERISGLSPTAAIREIGKLEARIEAELASKKKGKQDEQEDEGAGEGDAGEEGEEGRAEGKGEEARNADGTFKPKKRQAPEPIEPGSARSANTNIAPTDKDDAETWMRKRQAQIARERQAQRAR